MSTKAVRLKTTTSPKSPKRKKKPPSTHADKQKDAPYPSTDAEWRKFMKDAAVPVEVDVGPNGELQPTPEQVKALSIPGFPYAPTWSDPEKFGGETVRKHADDLIRIAEASDKMADRLEASTEGCADMPGMADTTRALVQAEFGHFKDAARDGFEFASQTYAGKVPGMPDVPIYKKGEPIVIVRWGDHHWPRPICEATRLLNSLVSAMHHALLEPAPLKLEPNWVKGLRRASSLLRQAVDDATKGTLTGSNQPETTKQAVADDEDAPVGGEPAVFTKLESCPVTLDEQTKRATVLGKEKPALKWTQYTVVSTLVACWPDTLTKDQLVSITKHQDARGILDRLAKSDTDWDKVIHMAKRTGGGYSLIATTQA